LDSRSASWKKFLFPPIQKNICTHKVQKGLISELEATNIQEPTPTNMLSWCTSLRFESYRNSDKVFLGGPFIDPVYEKKTHWYFIVTVNCGQQADLFCASMVREPKAESGFDLALDRSVE